MSGEKETVILSLDNLLKANIKEMEFIYFDSFVEVVLETTLNINCNPLGKKRSDFMRNEFSHWI
jgi:hypothetical protein